MRRYPGAPPFEDSPADEALFHGRSDEITRMYQRLLGTRLLVLYGVSGLGKTSLLKAGVFPKLRQQGLLPLYLLPRSESPDDLLTDLIGVAKVQPGIKFDPGERGSFWEFFKTSMFWRDDLLLKPILVLDQFEEVFTLKSQDFRLALAREIGSLSSGRIPDVARHRRKTGESILSDSPPDVGVVLGLREEHVGALEELTSSIPGLLQERFRLLPLSRDNAARAIEEPAALQKLPEGVTGAFDSPPFSYEPETLEKMLRFLLGRSGAVEPWQLQLLCEYVEEKVIKQAASGRSAIVVDERVVGGESGMESVLRDFYSRAIAKVDLPRRARARMLCEEGLLSHEGHRLSLTESQIRKEYGVEKTTLDKLVDARLLRSEKRLDNVFYELSHDSLVSPILSARPWRLPKKWRQRLAFGGPIALASLLILAVWNVRLDIAKQETQRERDRAEELVGFLIGEDWLDKLRDIGRGDIIEDVQSRVEEYVNAVPAEGRSRPAYLRNTAIAHRTRGELYTDRGNLAKAMQEFASAEIALRRLIDLRPDNPAGKKELGITLMKRSVVDREQGNLRRGHAAMREAFTLLQGVAAASPGNPAANRHLGDTHIYLAEVLEEMKRPEDALRNYNDAVALAQRMKRMSAADRYWQSLLQSGLQGRADILVARNGPNDLSTAKGTYAESLALAEQLSSQDPLNARYKFRLAVAVNRLGNIQMRDDTSNLQEARRAYEKLYDTLLELARRDPKNLQRERDVIYTIGMLGEAVYTIGMLGEAEAKGGDKRLGLSLQREAAHKMAELAEQDPSNLSWQFDVAKTKSQLGYALSRVGNRDIALEQFGSALDITEQLISKSPDHPAYQVTRNDMLVAIADVLVEKDSVAKAVERLEAARAGYLHLAKATPHIAGYHIALSSTIMRLVRLRQSTASVEETTTDINAALDAARTAARLAPEDMYAHMMLAQAHYRLGMHVVRDQPKEALAAYEESHRAAQSVTRLAPTNHLAHNWADLALLEISKLKLDDGLRLEAHKTLQAALNHAKRARSIRPDDETLNNNLMHRVDAFADRTIEVSTHMLKQGDATSARAALRSAAAELETATKLRPRDSARHRKLVTVLHHQIRTIDSSTATGRTERRDLVKQQKAILENLLSQGELNESWQRYLRDLQ